MSSLPLDFSEVTILDNSNQFKPIKGAYGVSNGINETLFSVVAFEKSLP